MRRVDFFYDVVCPYAYLGHTQIVDVARRAGAELVYRPFLLGGVFRGIGAGDGPMAGMPAAKAAMNARDLARWADWFGVPLRFPAGHPNRTVLALRAILASGALPVATRALFEAYWVHARDVSDPEVVRSALDDVGLDGAELVRRAGDADIKDALRARTDEAIAAGVFGAPAFVIAGDGGRHGAPMLAGDGGRHGAPMTGELFWGQDRLAFVEEALGLQPTSRPRRGGGEHGKTLELFFDVSSPFAYLAATQAPRIARAHGATLVYRPFLLGALFKAIGTPDVPLFTFPEAKRSYVARDLARWAARWGVPFSFPSRFPMKTVTALRMILVAPEDRRGALVSALFRALWVDDQDLADPAVLGAIAAGVGLDGAALLVAAGTQAAKDALRDATAHAERLGVCGAPSFLVGDQLYWGQDRLDFVEAALDGAPPAPATSTSTR